MFYAETIVNTHVALLLLLLTVLNGIVFPSALLAQDENAALENEEKRLKIEASIESLKAQIAASKRKQLLEKIPPSEIKALTGKVDISNYGSVGLIVAVDLARELAEEVCSAIPANTKVVVYSTSLTSGVISARLLETQIVLFRNSLNDALGKADAKVLKMFNIGLGAAGATGSIKAVAELVSLFKTNITATKTDFTDAKSVFVTAMAEECQNKIFSIGEGYIGELDITAITTLRNKALKIIEDRAKLEIRIAELNERIATESDETEKEKLKTLLGKLKSVATQVDEFLKVIMVNDISDKSPLAIAGTYLAHSKRINGSNILDLNIKLEGLSIIKENIITGQQLRLSATAIVWYRLHNIDGTLIKAGVIRRIAEPIKINLRGRKPVDDFWHKKRSSKKRLRGDESEDCIGQ